MFVMVNKLCDNQDKRINLQATFLTYILKSCIGQFHQDGQNHHQPIRKHKLFCSIRGFSSLISLFGQMAVGIEMF